MFTLEESDLLRRLIRFFEWTAVVVVLCVVGYAAVRVFGHGHVAWSPEVVALWIRRSAHRLLQHARYGRHAVMIGLWTFARRPLLAR